MMRIVLFREKGCWLAQALEHDVGVQADTLKDLILHMEIALDIEGAALAHLPPAPKYFQDLWPLRAGLFDPDRRLAASAGEIRWGLVA